MMFRKPATPREPVPLAQRQRALWQGALGVIGALPGMIGGSLLLRTLGITSRAPLLLLLAAAFASVIYGVWKLGQARDGRWDGWGLLALAVLLPGYPLLFVFTGWVALALYSLFSGQPVRLFGD